jgi:hypothetical protein
MREEETFVAFIFRVAISFWAYVTLMAMFAVTAVVISYMATTVYINLTDKEPIKITTKTI